MFVNKAAILRFFKLLKKPLVTPPDKSTNKVLLDPKGPLAKVLSSSAIKMVNDEVLKVTESVPNLKRLLPQVLHPSVESISNKRGKYLTLIPAQCFQVGKTAAEHAYGVTAALKYALN